MLAQSSVTLLMLAQRSVTLLMPSKERKCRMRSDALTSRIDSATVKFGQQSFHTLSYRLRNILDLVSLTAQKAVRASCVDSLPEACLEEV